MRQSLTKCSESKMNMRSSSNSGPRADRAPRIARAAEPGSFGQTGLHMSDDAHGCVPGIAASDGGDLDAYVAEPGLRRAPSGYASSHRIFCVSLRHGFSHLHDRRTGLVGEALQDT